MTVKATVTSTLNTQSVEFTLVETGPHGHHAHETETLSGGTETFIFTELDGGRDKTYYPKVSPETGDVTSTAQVPYGFDVDIDPLPHRDNDISGRVREDTSFSQGVGARQLGLGGNALTNGLLTAALNDGEALADDGYVYSSVQAAQDAASSWIFIGPGTFNESVTINTAALDVRGSGYETLIDGGSVGDAINISAGDVSVSNLSVQSSNGSGINAGGTSGVLIDNCWSRSTSSHGLLAGVEGVITNSTANNAGAIGIRPLGNRAIISNCNVDNATQHGIQSPNGTDDGIIVGCVITNTTDFHGLQINGGNDNLVGNCRIHNSGSNGIRIGGTDNVIYNNRVSGSGSADINDAGTTTTLDANLTGVAN